MLLNSNGRRVRRHRHHAAVFAIAALAFFPADAIAGMPAPVRLTDIGRMRLQTISFFLLILFLSAALIQWLWNGLRPTFPRLPKLNYPRALSLVVLWGLLFVVVLAMISGARELMTPGAWEKHGATYRLKEAK
jgi:hypothetical protein